jgi:hypothetical protein
MPTATPVAIQKENQVLPRYPRDLVPVVFPYDTLYLAPPPEPTLDSSLSWWGANEQYHMLPRSDVSYQNHPPVPQHF